MARYSDCPATRLTPPTPGPLPCKPEGPLAFAIYSWCHMLRVALSLLLVCSVPALAAEPPEADVVVYGGTSSAVIAAVQVRKMGRSVVIVSPDKHLGGLSSGGLGWTDSGNKAAIGGLSREFYHRVWKHYQQNDAWKWQPREQYGNKGQGAPAIDGEQRTMWIFEPHVAEQVYEDLVAEFKIPVHREEYLDRAPGKGVQMKAGRITAITTLSGTTYRGRMFLDATYEGDLLASAGVDYHVGREANSVYNEQWNGIQVGVLHHGHWFKEPISPYIKPGDPASGLLPRISGADPGIKGEGDHRVQAYCFRMCLTNVDDNRIPFPKPEGYDPSQYELLLRVLATGWRDAFHKFDPIPNHKTDTNNHGPFSTDNIGYNYDYPDASYERRREIIHEHEVYQKGLMYFLANDRRVPDDVRNKMAQWGLPKDEFTDNGGWPHQIYVREARRMIGKYVMTEHDCLDKKVTPESVGMGSYTLDSHNVQRYITPEGFVQNEGDIGVHVPRPYEIAYSSLVPRKEQCENLLVPVCVSCSHIAFGSIRMEPVFMILGQSAATAACMSLDADIAVQDLPYSELQKQLVADGQVLELDIPHHKPAQAKDLKGGVIVDDEKAELTGNWSSSGANGPFHGYGYHHDGNEEQGKKTARFVAKLKPGRYEVRFAYSPNNNRSSKVQVRIDHANGMAKTLVNEKKPGSIDGQAVSLGTYDFGEEGAVFVTNAGSDGHVVIDAVQFLPVQ
ncbi:MAG: FAD-dependent oxidoreductase [Planctomycetaceae bacterium]|nr:FAD-dependent oxidoreductase [Planctomycetaceae bacterium]